MDLSAPNRFESFAHHQGTFFAYTVQFCTIFVIALKEAGFGQYLK